MKISRPDLFIQIFLLCAFFNLLAIDDCGYAESFIDKGVWISCFSHDKVLSSDKKVIELLQFCKETGINNIYLQLYRGGQAYYNSDIVDDSQYIKMKDMAGSDTLDALLVKARDEGIKVFAWINIFSIGDNKNAEIVKKFSEKILTVDQYGRMSARGRDDNETDKYYIRDNQYFLEPADEDAKKYMLDIVTEVVAKYPALSGIHLDYIRYPYILPYLPDSRFIKYGISYGWSKKNIKRFEREQGITGFGIAKAPDYSKEWDDWRREQVSDFVEVASRKIKEKAPYMKVSCAVMPSPESAYLLAFQPWASWLDNGTVDYVVIMDYSKDTELAVMRAKAAIACGGSKVHVGLGAFLMGSAAEEFRQQYESVKELNPSSIVFFSYDNKELIKDVLR